jgi:hypothetical protein
MLCGYKVRPIPLLPQAGAMAAGKLRQLSQPALFRQGLPARSRRGEGGRRRHRDRESPARDQARRPPGELPEQVLVERLDDRWPWAGPPAVTVIALLMALESGSRLREQRRPAAP